VAAARTFFAPAWQKIKNAPALGLKNTRASKWGTGEKLKGLLRKTD
jgi:hypothetical protein